jgi:hypothetical protein
MPSACQELKTAMRDADAGRQAGRGGKGALRWIEMKRRGALIAKRSPGEFLERQSCGFAVL